VVQVNEYSGNKDAAKNHYPKSKYGVIMAIEPPTQEKKCAGECLNQWIANGEGLPTATCLASQQEPREHREIIKPSNGDATYAPGTGFDHRSILGNAMDTDIEEAAEAGAQTKEKNEEHPWIVRREKL